MDPKKEKIVYLRANYEQLTLLFGCTIGCYERENTSLYGGIFTSNVIFTKVCISNTEELEFELECRKIIVKNNGFFDPINYNCYVFMDEKSFNKNVRDIMLFIYKMTLKSTVKDSSDE